MNLAVLQARTSSTRLPGKVLKTILGRPMIALQLERVQRATQIDKLVVATTDDKSDDSFVEALTNLGVEVFRGDLNDVLDRYYRAAKKYLPKTVIRLTGDCPLADPEVIDKIVTFFHDGGYDYASNTISPTFPDGLDVEVMSFTALETAWREARLSSEREHVTPYLKNNPGRFRLGSFCQSNDLSQLRWTVDEPEDFQFVTSVYESLYEQKPDFLTSDVLSLLKENPKLNQINSDFERNEGLTKSINDDFSRRYEESLALHERASRVIPLGSQTFSKSKTQYPLGISPLFISHGLGSKVWDVDGNRYIDFVNSLASITLGYCDPEVTSAVEKQLKRGTIFTLPGTLEMEVAELLVEMVPCAEMVRFGKNGSDATSAAIRLARAYTNRDHVAVCGYHGWQDWYIGSTARNRGVPKSVCELVHPFTFNDTASLEALFQEFDQKIAAVILEPMNSTLPNPEFLLSVKEIAKRNGAVLVFDETITGFRYANGGAQEYFGITPDLATFGKGIANGFPLAAVCGKREIMMLMEEIFFSSTFGGELLSLAASQATLRKLREKPVVETMRVRGQELMTGVNRLLVECKVSDFITISGHPSWSFLTFKDTLGFTAMEIKTFFLQEVFARGILTIGTHNLSFSHSNEDILSLLDCYKNTFGRLRQELDNHSLRNSLRAKPLENLFKIR